MDPRRTEESFGFLAHADTFAANFLESVDTSAHAWSQPFPREWMVEFALHTCIMQRSTSCNRKCSDLRRVSQQHHSKGTQHSIFLSSLYLFFLTCSNADFPACEAPPEFGLVYLRSGHYIVQELVICVTHS